MKNKHLKALEVLAELYEVSTDKIEKLFDIQIMKDGYIVNVKEDGWQKQVDILRKEQEEAVASGSYFRARELLKELTELGFPKGEYKMT